MFSVKVTAISEEGGSNNSKVVLILILGLTKTCTRRRGSRSLSAPTSLAAIEEICVILVWVSSISVEPVERPDLAYSVSLVCGMRIVNKRFILEDDLHSQDGELYHGET